MDTSDATPRYQRDDQEERLGPTPWSPQDAALILWEQAHGHDARLPCYTEHGCLLIERDLDDLLAALRVILLPAAWQEMTDGDPPHKTGMWVTILATEHMERLRALLAALDEK